MVLCQSWPGSVGGNFCLFCLPFRLTFKKIHLLSFAERERGREQNTWREKKDRKKNMRNNNEHRKKHTSTCWVWWLCGRFEKLDITPKSAQKIKPVLERWMSEAEERYKNGVQNLTDFIGSEPSKKRKRRTSFTPQALEVLNQYFERNTHPSGRAAPGTHTASPLTLVAARNEVTHQVGRHLALPPYSLLWLLKMKSPVSLRQTCTQSEMQCGLCFCMSVFCSVVCI